MKKIIILFAAFSLTFALAQAQGGYGYNDGARSQRGYRGGTTTYSGGVTTTRHYNGYNRGYARGYNNRACAPQQRVRFEWSPCRTFRWRIVEQAYWVPPRVVYRNGCRTQAAGYYDWRCTDRSRVYASGYGPRGRR